ncbi:MULTISPECIES: pyridoxal phosphate-dependent aminotransferase [Halocynthiibacter]|uniref:Pyridoxal phosphate-dependent aminotransferase n=1 Tax=Halocynthiibacter halioticoli TaxID=2986804 RepID=A0AAE3LRZ7_9RHOB|nr:MULTISPECIES: pyridoxal phosphate-dependent aminotransferase [Halocynthiibacter]MCV6824999.1 pyridoxal phosphate-dependent aminotransferase [Halocynthiibacter halioticoli]MCW4058000.1 pyridoxal phosphate-dependent aminotransferase [Halocynthiibacter sp. SDUM655004]
MTAPKTTAIAQTLSAISPFVGPETNERARGKPFAARLGANESVFGPSPKAIAAMQDAAKDVWMYADAECFELRNALADYHGLSADNILIGEGIDGLLNYVVRLFIEPGDCVVTSAGAYPTFNYHVAGFGGKIETVPFKDDREDPDALLDKARECAAKLVYIANPDNPMGSWHNADVIEDMIARLPDGCLLILDEAYIEFAPEGTAPEWDMDNPQVLRMRTFSKAYGMAGARVGYAIGHPDLIRDFGKIRNHFGASRISLEGAVAALADQDYLVQTQDNVARSRARIAEAARANGLEPLPSATNFVTIDCKSDSAFAKRVLSELMERDIFVRMPFNPPQDRCIRISTGPEREMELFEEALPKALTAARAED